MVLPVSLQERIAEEAEAKKKGSLDDLPVTGLNNEERKNAERKMRRASIAVGVMSALAKQGSLIASSSGQNPSEEIKKPQKRETKRNSSIKATIKQNFRSSIFSSGLSGIVSMPSGINIPFLDAKGSSGISSTGPFPLLHVLSNFLQPSCITLSWALAETLYTTSFPLPEACIWVSASYRP